MLEQQKLDIGLIAEAENRRYLSFLPVNHANRGLCLARSYLENLRIPLKVPMSDPFESGIILLLDRSNMTRITHIDAYFAEHGIDRSRF